MKNEPSMKVVVQRRNWVFLKLENDNREYMCHININCCTTRLMKTMTSLLQSNKRKFLQSI